MCHKDLLLAGRCGAAAGWSAVFVESTTLFTKDLRDYSGSTLLKFTFTDEMVFILGVK